MPIYVGEVLKRRDGGSIESKAWNVSLETHQNSLGNFRTLREPFQLLLERVTGIQLMSEPRLVVWQIKLIRPSEPGAEFTGLNQFSETVAMAGCP
ncbi:hypothetical protein D3C76_829800 [compost metagenome]